MNRRGTKNGVWTGEDAKTTVGLYLHSNNSAWFGPGPQTTRRCNTGILIEGESTHPDDGGHGWDTFIRCRKGLGGGTDDRFTVDRMGNVWAKGSLTVVGNIIGNITTTGDILGQNDIAAMNTVQALAEMYAMQFVTTSSASLKENIVPVATSEAVSHLGQLRPVRYNLKAKPDRQLMGFVVEDVPPPFAVAAKGVDVMAVVATLTAVARAQQDTISELRARVDALEGGGSPP